MTDDQKRQEKAMLLLAHEETRQHLELLNSKAYAMSEKIRKIGEWLNEVRRVDTSHRCKEHEREILGDEFSHASSMNFPDVKTLVAEIKQTQGKLEELTTQKKALGLGA